MQNIIAKSVACLALLSAAAASAHDHAPPQAATLHVHQAWSRPTVAAVPVGVVYMDLDNQGSTTERLLSASSEVAGRVELHESIMDGEMMRMRPIQAVDIAPTSTTQLKPGGLHLMLMGLKAPLVQGQTFPLSLVFEQTGTVTVQVQVRDPVGSAGGHGSHSPHDAHGHHGHKH